MRPFLLLLSTILLLIARPSAAVDYCVNTGAAFTAAVIEASLSDSDDTIKVAASAITLTAPIDRVVAGDLSIRGGYSAGCPLFNSASAATTINGAAGSEFHLGVPSANVTLSRLRFSGFTIVRIIDTSWTYAVNTGRILVQRCAFVGNQTGLTINSSHHDVRVENNLFSGSSNDGGNIFNGAGLSITGNPPTSLDIAVEVINNTSTSNQFGYTFYSIAPANFVPVFVNNVAFDNRFTDLLLRQPVLASNNVWVTQNFDAGGALIAGSANNLVVNPQLDVNLKPIAPSSPLINSGNNAPPGGLPSADHGGGARKIGSTVDRGAYESSVNDAAVLTVTNNNNSGAGSLRQAILDANTNPNPKSIEFNIPGACPRVIPLTTVLPAVTQPTFILGYSQPGSVRNDHPTAFDGSLCVALVGEGFIGTGLHLQTGVDQATTLEGIAFNGFTSEAVRVSGAGVVMLAGNTFGMDIPGIILTDSGFDDVAIRVEDAAGSFIGGVDDAGRNVIGRAAVAGIRLESADGRRTVQNNLIGFDPTGLLPRANGIGLIASAGSGDSVRDNWFGFSTTHGLLVEASATPAVNLAIVSNTFGYTVNYQNAGNGGNGARFSGGNNHNFERNQVANSGTDGVVVLSTARRVNIYANQISGSTLQAIDLSPNGVNPIDLDVGATGANDQQNYPTLTAANGNADAGVVVGNLSSANGSYRIQFFATSGCDADGYGESATYAGETHVVIANATAAANGNIGFAADLFGNISLLGRAITAIATDEEGNSSEVSACITYVQGPQLFKDGFE